MELDRQRGSSFDLEGTNRPDLFAKQNQPLGQSHQLASSSPSQ